MSTELTAVATRKPTNRIPCPGGCGKRVAVLPNGNVAVHDDRPRLKGGHLCKAAGFPPVALPSGGSPIRTVAPRRSSKRSTGQPDGRKARPKARPAVLCGHCGQLDDPDRKVSCACITDPDELRRARAVVEARHVASVCRARIADNEQGRVA